LNTIVAEALDEICTHLEKSKKGKKDFNETIQKLLQNIIKKHKRVIFNGDNYTEGWLKEAKKRGLPNLKTTPEALEVLRKPYIVEVFEKSGVLSKKELMSRYEVYRETYETTLDYEGKLAADMARTEILPAVMNYQEELADTIRSVEAVNKTKVTAKRKLLKDITTLTENALVGVEKLEAALKKGNGLKTKEAMSDLRKPIDALEGLVPSDKWPLPSYAEMLFML